MKKILVIVFLYVGISTLFAQNGNVQTTVSKSEIIAKSRQRLIDLLIENKNDDIKTNYKYLVDSLENEYYVTLFPMEKWFVLYWLGDYQTLLKEISNTDTSALKKIRSKVYPAADDLYKILYHKIITEKTEIGIKIKTSVISDEEKDFLLLLLETYTTESYGEKKNNDLNEKSELFLMKYKNDKYGDFIYDQFYKKYEPKGFGFGMELYPTVVILSGDINKLTNDLVGFGCGFEWYFGKFQLNTKGIISRGKLMQDLTFPSVVWRKNNFADIMCSDISLEYKIKFKEKFLFSPIIGIGTVSFYTSQSDVSNDPNLENIELSSTAGPILGLDLSYLLFDNYVQFTKPRRGFSSVNIKYYYQFINFNSKFSNFNGSSHNFIFGWSFGFGGASKIKKSEIK